MFSRKCGRRKILKNMFLRHSMRRQKELNTVRAGSENRSPDAWGACTGRWKMLHYYAKRFFQKTMIWADGKDQKAEIYVIHDGQEEVSAEIRWSLKKK